MRDNFIRFARMKKERGSKVQIVVQMVQMDGNRAEAEDFMRFWRGVPGVDQVRLKQDETSVLQPDAVHDAEDWKHPCHYLWRGPMYVKHNGDVYPCCQSYALDGRPIGRIGEQPLEGDLEFGADPRDGGGCTPKAGAARSTSAPAVPQRFRIRRW